MPTGNSIFKELEPQDKVPEYLKHALVAEVDSIRNTMQVVTHFTEQLLSSLSICLSVYANEEPN
ncbi:hypothetical protein [Dyadobacter sp. NIV53]|uniref:hypothetical protein n=1 Tax=Dyadobacter sp. NIV53 TaxID=2861765 RepID=UPI001C855673|nr:hypothetical protein [Dyadobacter sp. NIV53]